MGSWSAVRRGEDSPASRARVFLARLSAKLTEAPLALDRQSIEKRDFPFGRRGYEPAAVDAHLAALAREIEALKRTQAAAPPASAAAAAAPAPSRREPLASVASAQVQAIVEAAEASAAAIERDAREHAEQTAQDA